MTTLFDVKTAYLYEGMPTKRSIHANMLNATVFDIDRIRKQKRKRFSELRSYGYIVRHKPVATVDGDNKCNFDVELSIDAIDQMQNYDVFVLGSGDGDFIRLVKYMRGRGKSVHVVGPKKSNKELRQEARGNFRSIAGMRSHISKG